MREFGIFYHLRSRRGGEGVKEGNTYCYLSQRERILLLVGWFLFGVYLVMYVDTGLEQRRGGLRLPSSRWEMCSLVICHSIHTSTDFQKKTKKKLLTY